MFPVSACMYFPHVQTLMSMISSYSDCLAGILVDLSRRDVKDKRPGFAKPYWPEELSDLKRLSVQAPNLWSLNGRLKYKGAIRLARVNFEKGVNDKLADKLQQGDLKGIWDKWNTVFGVASSHNASIEGDIDLIVMANEFAHYFARNFLNSSDNVMLKNKFEIVYKSMLVL